MSFLSWVASWAERIPVVGSYIASLVEYIEDGIEWTYGWLKSAYYSLIDEIYRVIRPAIDSLQNTYRYYVKPTLSWLEDGYDWLRDKLDWFYDYLWRYIEPAIDSLRASYSWLKGVYDSYVSPTLKWLSDSFSSFRIWAIGSFNYVLNWISNAPNWLWSQLQNARDKLWSLVHPYIKPLEDWWNWFTSAFNDFLKDPIGFIEKVVIAYTTPIAKALTDFVNWAEPKIRDLQNAILHIDDFLMRKFVEFIGALIAWFLWSFLYDLVTLEYDPETGEIYGEPKNPVTKFLIWFFEMDMPEYPYQSVKEEVTQ